MIAHAVERQVPAEKTAPRERNAAQDQCTRARCFYYRCRPLCIAMHKGLEESATVGGCRPPRRMSGLEKFVNPHRSVSGSTKVQPIRPIPDIAEPRAPLCDRRSGANPLLQRRHKSNHRSKVVSLQAVEALSAQEDNVSNTI